MKKENKDTRYFIDIDLVTKRVIKIDYGDRYKLQKDIPKHPIHRIFLTAGQYNKLVNEIE